MKPITVKQAVLIHRMKWNLSRERKPAPEDAALVPHAIRMLSYIACLNYAVYDLEEELTAAGLYRQQVKKRYRQIQAVVQEVHETAYQMLHNSDPQAARQYNDAMDGSWAEIQNAVLLEAPPRAFNIIVALCRLIEKLNIRLGGKYDFAPAKRLYSLPTLLGGIGIPDHQIDVIIEHAVS